jgi:CRP-like cAMP-binding protein
MIKVAKSRNQMKRYMGQLMMISLAVERLLWFAVMLVVTLHIGACGWVFVGRLNNEFEAENWIMVGGFADLDNVELYIVAMYWVMTTVATVGYGDIHPVNTEERVFNCFTMLAGVCIYSYMIGALTNLISSLDSRKSKLTQKLELLRQLSRTYGLSAAFADKLSGAIEYEHRNTNKEIDELVSNLPTSLKTQLLTTIHHKKIENNAFFEGKSASFVAYIAPLLRPYRIEAGEIVYKEGDPATEMYFLVTGEVEFVLDKENEYVCYVSVSPGYYFGEVDLLFAPSFQRLHTTKTAGRTEVLSLSREHFEAMLVAFESESFEVLTQAKDRSIRIDERRRTAEAEYSAKKQVSRHHSVPQDLETRLQRAASMKHTLEEEDESSSLTIGDEPPSSQLKLDLFANTESTVRSAFARLNTFGDTEYTSITQDLVRKKTHRRKKRRHRSSKEMMRYIQKLQEEIESLSQQLGKRGRSPDVKEVPEEEEGSEEGLEGQEATPRTITPVMNMEEAKQA